MKVYYDILVGLTTTGDVPPDAALTFVREAVQAGVWVGKITIDKVRVAASYTQREEGDPL